MAARYGYATDGYPQRMTMTFDLVRLGWPNTAALLALALMPAVALTLPAPTQRASLQVEDAAPDLPPAAVAVVATERAFAK